MMGPRQEAQAALFYEFSLDYQSYSSMFGQDLLLAILTAYEMRGESELATRKLGAFLTARFGSVSDGKVKAGGLPAVKDAFRRMQEELYSSQRRRALFGSWRGIYVV